MGEMITVGQRIRDRREALGLSQEEVAVRLEKDVAYVNEIENMGNEMTTTVISAFAKALETTPAFLMGWEQ